MCRSTPTRRVREVGAGGHPARVRPHAASSSTLFWFLIRRAQSGGAGGLGGLGNFGRSPRHGARTPRSSGSLRRRGRDGRAKRDLQEIVQFLKEPERFRRLGGKVPRGVLLVGPPGTGKTLLARAVAGEAGVPFFSINGSESIEPFVGVGASRVRELFEETKKAAPAIVFIDELDAVGRCPRLGSRRRSRRTRANPDQLLSEMDGFPISPSCLPRPTAPTCSIRRCSGPALRPARQSAPRTVTAGARSSRFTRASMPLAVTSPSEALASTTPGILGADLANLANEAALLRLAAVAASPAWPLPDSLEKILLGDPRGIVLSPEERGGRRATSPDTPWSGCSLPTPIRSKGVDHPAGAGTRRHALEPWRGPGFLLA